MAAPSRLNWSLTESGASSVAVSLSSVPDGAWMVMAITISSNVELTGHPAGWRNPLLNTSQAVGSRRFALALRTKVSGDTTATWANATDVGKRVVLMWGTGAAPDVSTWVTGLIGVRSSGNVVAGQSVLAGDSTHSVAPGVDVATADSLVLSVLFEATAATGTFSITSGATSWSNIAEGSTFIEAISFGYSTPAVGTTGAVTATATASQASNGAGVQIVLPPPSAGPIERTGAVSATATLSGQVSVQYRNGFSSVEQMLATPGATWAHRGGSANWPEMSEYAYTQAALYGYGALEFSAHRTSDGVWIGSHDPSLNRTSQTSGLPNISAMTWAQVQTYMNSLTSAGTPRPYYRLDDFLDKFTPTHVCIVDPKNDVSRVTEFLALCDAHGGNTKIVVKFFGGGSGAAALADAASAKNYQTWGYYYEADIASGELAAWQSHWSILGMEYTASQSAWNTVKSYGKPITGHIIPDQAGYNTAISKGATMVQVANVAGVTAVSAGYYGTVSATASISATPASNTFRDGTVSATSSVSATPLATIVRAATVSATAEIQAAPSKNTFRDGTVSATASVSATPIPVISVPVLISGSGTFSATAEVVVSTEAGLTGAGSLSAAAETFVEAPVSLSGSGSLSVVISTEGSADAVADLSGVGTLSAAVSLVHEVEAIFTGSGTVSAISVPEIDVEADYTGVGVLSAEVSTESSVDANAVFSGLGNLSMAIEIIQSVEAVFVGDGTLDALASPVATQAANFLSTGDLSVVVQSEDSAAADALLTGSGSLQVAVEVLMGVSAMFSGSGTSSAPVEVAYDVAAPYSGGGGLTVVARAVEPEGTQLYVNGRSVSASLGNRSITISR